MRIADAPVTYLSRLARRSAEEVDLLVVHCTELPSMAEARELAERLQAEASRTGFCGHYYVDRDGGVTRMVGELRVAHHVRGHNRHSIGVELVNRGRYPHWYRSSHQGMTEPYPAAQIDGLVELVELLRRRLPALTRIAGHEDLDRGLVPAEDDPAVLIRRKVDPGPLFPWSAVVRRTGLRRLRGKPEALDQPPAKR